MLCWNLTRTLCRRQCLDMTADVHATLGGVGGTTPSQKSPKLSLPNKTINKAMCTLCQNYPHLLLWQNWQFMFLYPKWCNGDQTSPAVGVISIPAGGVISIPAAAARGQQGTGLCKNLAVELHWQTHSIFSPIHWICCAAHTEPWSIQPLPWGFFLFNVESSSYWMLFCIPGN